MQKLKSLLFTFLAALALLFSIYANAAPEAHRVLDYMVKATFIANYDGDTIKVDIPGLHPLIGKSVSIRIRGIDTPEIRGKCQKEKVKAWEARERVHELLVNAETILLERMSRGKYFRIVADVFADEVNIGDTLIKENLAIAYFGGKKTTKWCD